MNKNLFDLNAFHANKLSNNTKLRADIVDYLSHKYYEIIYCPLDLPIIFVSSLVHLGLKSPVNNTFTSLCHIDT